MCVITLLFLDPNCVLRYYHALLYLIRLWYYWSWSNNHIRMNYLKKIQGSVSIFKIDRAHLRWSPDGLQKGPAPSSATEMMVDETRSVATMKLNWCYSQLYRTHRNQLATPLNKNVHKSSLESSDWPTVEGRWRYKKKYGHENGETTQILQLTTIPISISSSWALCSSRWDAFLRDHRRSCVLIWDQEACREGEGLAETWTSSAFCGGRWSIENQTKHSFSWSSFSFRWTSRAPMIRCSWFVTGVEKKNRVSGFCHPQAKSILRRFWGGSSRFSGGSGFTTKPSWCWASRR